MKGSIDTVPKNSIVKLSFEEAYIKLALLKSSFLQEDLIYLINILLKITLYINDNKFSKTEFNGDIITDYFVKTEQKTKSILMIKPDKRSLLGIIPQLIMLPIMSFLYIFTLDLNLFLMPWLLGAFTGCIMLLGYHLFSKRLDYLGISTSIIITLSALYTSVYFSAGMKLSELISKANKIVGAVEFSLWEGMRLYPEIGSFFITLLIRGIISAAAVFTAYIGIYLYREGDVHLNK